MKKNRKLVIVLVVFAIFAVLIFLVVRKLSGAAVGKIDPVSASPTTSKSVPTVNYTRWEGKYAAFDYNSTYHADKQALGPNTLERVGLIGGERGTRYVALLVDKSASGRLDDSSSVHFRQLNPSTYKMETTKIAGRDGLIFTNNKEGYEKAAFVAGNGNVTSLVLSSSAGSPEDLDKEFAQLVGSLKLK